MGKLSVFAIALSLSVQVFAFTSSKSIDYIGDDGPGANFRDSWSGGGSCSDVPASAQQAYREAVAFSKGCGTAQLAPGKKIAINDYSGRATPSMYVFDQNGDCIMSVPVSWGSGAVPRGSLKACSVNNSKQTPPGFHLTAPHTGGSRFNEGNSIGLAGLSGQNSLGDRGILIHATGSAGRGTSWGCSGVPPQTFPILKNTLGYGSLVYNYFGSSSGQSCGSSAGFAPPTCQPERQAVATSNSLWGRIRSAVTGQQPTGSSGGGTRSNTRTRSNRGAQ